MTLREQIQIRIDGGMTEDEAFTDLARLEYIRKCNKKNVSPKERERIRKQNERPLLDWIDTK